MARDLVFTLKNEKFLLQLIEIKRSKLYDWTHKLILGEENQECEVCKYG